ncbi:hypothetical protein O6H91_01G094500 [Diphasiastrum complanatum]|uniref:Uncharacterized protein n=1 Tax=Diphasiastrum complanatum TaxID=34168 RepID=A0ACC2ETL6_DIPCM|nr:hypothetical protein O6H91_01G094500 [Diphasiastrum complanatum]
MDQKSGELAAKHADSLQKVKGEAMKVTKEEIGLTAQLVDTVLGLYEALKAGEVKRVQAVITEDLEWWFHGPPSQRHLMRILIGADPLATFAFVPLRVCAIDNNKVVVEGKQEDLLSDVWWVHAWTVKDGIVTQLREYFNTTLTITATTSINTTNAHVPNHSLSCSSILWQSKLSNVTGKSFPGLVLAI